MRWLHYDSTSIRRPFDCLSEVIKVTVTQPASRSDAGRSAAARGRNVGRPVVVARS